MYCSASARLSGCIPPSPLHITVPNRLVPRANARLDSLTVTATSGNVDLNGNITADAINLSNLDGGVDVDHEGRSEAGTKDPEEARARYQVAAEITERFAVEKG